MVGTGMVWLSLRTVWSWDGLLYCSELFGMWDWVLGGGGGVAGVPPSHETQERSAPLEVVSSIPTSLTPCQPECVEPRDTRCVGCVGGAESRGNRCRNLL